MNHRTRTILTFTLLGTLMGAATAPPSARAAQTVGLFLNDSTRASAGYTLFAPVRSTTTYLIDMHGLLVHSWPGPVTPGLSAYLLEDGHLFRAGNAGNTTFTAGGAGGRVQEIDWDGTLLWNYTYSNALHLQHHDAMRLPNGHALLIAWELKTQSEATSAGRNPAYVNSAGLWPDHLIEVAPLGATGGIIVWEWHVWDHLIQNFDSVKPNFGVVADHPELIDLNFVKAGPNATATDWNHTNGIDYNAELDQIVLSIHGWNEVWIIDHATTAAEAAGHTGGRQGHGGDLLYRWGNPRAYQRGATVDQRLFGQHNVQWVRARLPGAGHLLVFNNGTTRNGSSVDEFVPPVDATGAYALVPGSAYGPPATIWTYAATPSANFYAQNIGGAQRLVNGNTLVCDGPHGNFFEVAPDSAIVWNYVNPVIASGPMTQGDVIPVSNGSFENSAFRSPRYAPDYPGLAGHDLSPHGTLEIVPLLSVREEGTGSGVALESSAPAPFVNRARLRFALATAASVSLTLHDIEGRVVRVLARGAFVAGRHDVILDAASLAPGIYFVSLATPRGAAVRKVVRLR